MELDASFSGKTWPKFEVTAFGQPDSQQLIPFSTCFLASLFLLSFCCVGRLGGGGPADPPIPPRLF